jgi:hypothetical protein
VNQSTVSRLCELTSTDIVLLSTTGHGLYLSTAMTPDHQYYATMALMCSLLISGAIGTWISIGGTYYLISMAFSAANMFVLTRLIGGLTTYLTVLAVLSTYQIPGSSFLNGRRIIIMVVPTLTISPLLTTFIWNHKDRNKKAYDIYIYPCVLYVFVSLLILGTRHVATQWVTWYHDIKTLNDSDVKDWCIQRYKQRESVIGATKSKCMSGPPWSY